MRIPQEIVHMYVVPDPHHLSVPPPQFHGGNWEPVGTGLPPMHDEELPIHPRQGQLPLPSQGTVVTEVGCRSGLRDTHNLDPSVRLNQAAQRVPVPPIEAREVLVE